MKTLEERVAWLEDESKDQKEKIDKYRRFVRGALVFFTTLYLALAIVFFVSYVELSAGLNYLHSKTLETHAFVGTSIFGESNNTVAGVGGDGGVCCKLRRWD